MAHAGLLSVWLDREIDNGNPHDLHPDASRRLAAAYSAMVEQDFRSGRTIHDYARTSGRHADASDAVVQYWPAGALPRRCWRTASISRRAKCCPTRRRPIKDIASDLGFSSAAYFTRAFQKQTGQTPSAFRKHG